MIVRNGTLTAGSAIVTAMERTDDLQPGIWVYGSGVPVDTTILTIDSATQITLSRANTLTGVKSLEITTAQVGVYHERNCALIDAKSIIDERGDLVQFYFRIESNVTRDKYNSIKKRAVDTKYNIRAYPVQFSPSEKQLEKAGIREQAEVVIYTAMKDWITAGINFEDFEMDGRSTVRLQGQIYEIRNKGLVNQMNDTFLNVSFGLYKK